jgi:uncharacterized membrane protein YhaH (DUF805 family)
MSHTTPPPAAGWYPDPQGAPAQRWWNGLAWTAATRPLAVPPVPPVAAPPYALAPTAYRVQPPTLTPSYAVAPYPSTPGAAPQPWTPARPVWAPPVRTLGEAVRGVLSRYAAFEGRASRSEFWYWTLFNVLVAVGAYAVLALSLLFGFTAFFGWIAYVALLGWWIAALVPTLAVSVRRLRDAGYPWGLIFLSLVPFGGIVLLVLHCQPSKFV